MHKNLREKLIEGIISGNIPPLLEERLNSNIVKGPLGHVNHFTIGGDPEFLLLAEKEGTFHQINAASLGLETGSAFGADTSGRQIEIRPWASRSALEVVASIGVTLRWFSSWLQEKKQLKAVSMICSPYCNNDGLGGHIHFGRRRKNLQSDEIYALNALSAYLETIGVFDKDTSILRRRSTHYGQMSDVRPQVYGYEYRTYPTYLTSPAQAMLVLTLAKLAVVDPEFIKSSQASLMFRKDILMLFLLLYRRRGDQDAAICVDWIRAQGWPRGSATFGSEWGLPVERRDAENVEYYPASIKPGIRDIEGIEMALRGQRIPPNWELIPTWEPTKLPKGFRIFRPDSGIGMGELCKGLCYPENAQFMPSSRGGQNGLGLGKLTAKDIEKRLGPNWKNILGKYLPMGSDSLYFGYDRYECYLGGDLRKDKNRQRTRKLLKLALPLVEIETLRTGVERERISGVEIADVSI